MSSAGLEPRKLTKYELWYGRNDPPPQRTLLRAGPLTGVMEGGDLWDIRRGDIELVRRIYVAVRDENWDTIPAHITDVSTDIHEDRFVVSYEAEHSSSTLRFRWHAQITGEQDGTIAFSMAGHAQQDFSYCRIGFCVLHPLTEYCGQPYHGRGPSGPVIGSLPTLIVPQRFEGGFYIPLFPSVSDFTVSLKSGIEMRFAFEGDLFEMEDQRNWTDGSFKTYCTPLSLGYPHTARAGQEFTQRVTLTAEGCPPERGASDSKVQLKLGPSLHRPLPRIGLGIASHNVDLSSHDADLLGRLRLDHLRVDLHLSHAGAVQELGRAKRECRLLRCGVELALFVTDNADQEFSSLTRHFPPSVPVSRILIYHEKELTTAARWAECARAWLVPHFPGVPICGGTNLNFADLNRSRPDPSALDGVAYSINPQVHASDESSLVQSLEGQHDTVMTAHSFCGDRPVIVTPITLKPRFNPDAVGPEPPPNPGELPGAVDARQMSLFAGAWTVGSAKQLAEAGAASVTFYETTGWRGIKETDQGCPLPEVFASFPGMVYPVYHVLADLADLKNGEVVTCRSSDPQKVQALAILLEGDLHILIANLTPQSQDCSIGPLGEGLVKARSLDTSSAPLAMADPLEFRSASQTRDMPVPAATLSLTLCPYSVVRIDPSGMSPRKEGIQA
jgi:D-apionolactonase